jgi:hypothetical protein
LSLREVPAYRHARAGKPVTRRNRSSTNFGDNLAVRRKLAAPIVLYLAWLGMLAVHELGHVIHAVSSGGRVVRVSFPLLGFSQTFVDPNPHPLLVAWGGPIWGAALPAIFLLAARMARRVTSLSRFFAGFCLISNGAYIGLGWLKRSGDAHDLARLGTPIVVLILFGVLCCAAGLFCWHRIPSKWWRP